MRVEVIRAWPRRHLSVVLELTEGTTAAQAARASGLPLENVAAYAVFGQACTPEAVVRDGDRLELLQALRVDPKEARRLRAAKRAGLVRDRRNRVTPAREPDD